MLYLIQHMWLCLLLAAALGALLMWLLRTWVMRDQVAEADAAWQTRWNDLESEHNRYVQELHVASAQTEKDLKTNYALLTDQYAALDADWKKKYGALEVDWRGRLANAEKGMAEVRAQLNVSMQERESLTRSLEEGAQKRTVLEAENEKARMQMDEWSSRLNGLEKEATEARTQIVMLTEERDRLQNEARAMLERSQAEDRALRQQLTATEEEREHLKVQLATTTESEAEWRSKCQETDSHYAAAQQQIAGLMTRVATLGALEARYTVAKERLGGDIERLETVGVAFGQRLRSVGIAWVVDLLEQCGTAQGRATIAEKTGFSTAQLLTWTNMADLLRISAMTPDWAELLHAAGVDTVKELAQRVPENLQQKMEEVNATAERKISPTVPNVTTVHSWVEQAKAMEYRITH